MHEVYMHGIRMHGRQIIFALHAEGFTASNAYINVAKNNIIIRKNSIIYYNTENPLYMHGIGWRAWCTFGEVIARARVCMVDRAI